MDTSLRVAYAPEITAAAARHHLDPRLLAAVAAQETGGPGADSGRNVVGDGGHGRGLFQVDDRWHAFARSPDAMDPAKNADYAAGLLAGNLRRYGGDVRAALSVYNAGSPTAAGTRTDWGDGRPVAYADSVLRHFSRLAGGGAPAQQPDAAASQAAPAAPTPAPAAPAPASGPLDGMLSAFWSFALPPRPPLARPDEHDRLDLAPAAGGPDDESAPAPSDLAPSA